MGFFALSILLVVAVVRPAAANAPGSEKIPRAVQNYGVRHRTCYEWSNGCVVCINDDNGRNCSAPGVACQPAVIHCRGTFP